MGALVSWILGGVVFAVMYFFLKNMFTKKNAFAKSKNPERMRNTVALIIAAVVGLLTAIIFTALTGGEKSKYGFFSGLFYDPNMNKEVKTGASTTIQDAVNKRRLLEETYGGKLSTKGMEHMRGRANVDGLTWADVNKEAAIIGNLNWVLQDHLLDNVNIVKIWPFDYNWTDVWNLNFAKASLQWYGYWRGNLEQPAKDMATWKGKTIGDLAMCHHGNKPYGDKSTPCP